jgi:cytochrome c oxidase cbb3-type subunit 2
MPPWFALPEADRWALVAHVKALAKAFAEDTAPQPIAIGAVPEATAARIARGKELFMSGGCASCHGNEGKGDGPGAPALRNRANQPIKPRDFTQPRFHRGSRVADVYLTLQTGLDGTPMAPFSKVMPADDLWSVATYVASLAPKFVDRGGMRCPERAGARDADEQAGARILINSLSLK